MDKSYKKSEFSILTIGSNSYIARNFISAKKDKYRIVSLKRGDGFEDYFKIKKETFAGIDVVVNFAAIVHNKEAKEKYYKRINAELPVYLAKLSKECGVKHFIQLSTVAVYGNNEYIDITTKPDPVNAYGMTKLEADESLEKMMEKGFTVSIIRPPMVYGKAAPGNMASLIKLVETGMPLPFDYRNNKRSMIFVGNLVDLIDKIIYQKSAGIFLVRDSHMPSIREIVETIKKSRGLKNFIFPLPKFFVNYLTKRKELPFYKLFGNLIIDDTETIKKVGEYRSYTFEEAMKLTLER
ncbi:NAD-dependent epimerase/dehydratase family protein [Caminibacter pacificus]